jgi:hypothetical protein
MDFSVSIVLIKTRDRSVATSPRAYGKSEEAPSNKESKNDKKLQQRKFTKTKTKEIVVPVPREDSKDNLLQDMTLPVPVPGSWSSICYRGRQEIEPS